MLLFLTQMLNSRAQRKPPAKASGHNGKGAYMTDALLAGLGKPLAGLFSYSWAAGCS